LFGDTGKFGPVTAASDAEISIIIQVFQSLRPTKYTTAVEEVSARDSKFIVIEVRTWLQKIATSYDYEGIILGVKPTGNELLEFDL